MTLRIGAGAGFAGDRIAPARDLAERLSEAFASSGNRGGSGSASLAPGAIPSQLGSEGDRGMDAPRRGFGDGGRHVIGGLDHQRPDRGLQVQSTRIAHRLHDAADVVQQFGGQLLRDADLVARGEHGVAGERAQVELHRGEFVAGDIMQLTRHAQAFGIALPAFHLGRLFGMRLQPGGNGRAARGIEPAVDVGVQFVVRGCFVQGLDGHRKAFRVDVGGVSSCIARSAWRARDNLDITVPTGTPMAWAASR